MHQKTPKHKNAFPRAVSQWSMVNGQWSRRAGQLSLQLIIFAAVGLILITGFASWTETLLTLSLRDLNKRQAFMIAEGGIEYYRWHLAHNQVDYTDGTGGAGPYIHNYFDKDAKLIGSFELTITPPPEGSTVVTIKSVGKVIADPSVSKTITVKLGINSFALFSVLANANDMQFGIGTEVFGPIHSNGGIRFDGLAHNLISSAVSEYDDPSHGGQNEFGVHTHVDPQDPLPPDAVPERSDVFMSGRSFPVPAIDFTAITQTLANLKTKAQASSTYYASSSAYGYDLVLATSGIYSLYKVTALHDTPNGCTNTSNEDGWAMWSIGSETFVATSTIPNGGVIFVEDDLWVRGAIDKKRLTVAAGRFPDNPSTWANITVNSSTLYTNYNGSDTLGIIAQNNFNVGLFSEDVLRIDGGIVAQHGRLGRHYYSPPNDQNDSNKCGPTVVRQQITLYGSIISDEGYGFGFEDGTGYQDRIIIYDANLLNSPPPDFPLLSTDFAQLSWDETQ
ncbi:MAG: hypothetical protein Q7S28_01635 [bacterium]|nr:hypothetical protein [bacterium]